MESIIGSITNTYWIIVALFSVDIKPSILIEIKFNLTLAIAYLFYMVC